MTGIGWRESDDSVWAIVHWWPLLKVMCGYVKGEEGVYEGQKSHNLVGGPSFQQFKAFMEISCISQISLE